VSHVSGLYIQPKENTMSIHQGQRTTQCLVVMYLCLMLSTGKLQM